MDNLGRDLGRLLVALIAAIIALVACFCGLAIAWWTNR